MALHNLTGCWGHHDLIDAVLKLAEKLCVNVLLLQFKLLYKIFVKVLIETHLNISNQFHFSYVYQSVNYIASGAN